MNSSEFNEVVMDQLQMCMDTLGMKAGEYAQNDNRLHNFEMAAGMMGCDRKEALAGMMAKHTISIYDMCRDNRYHPYDIWCEKIQDHINYLLLLKALVVDDEIKIRNAQVEQNIEEIKRSEAEKELNNAVEEDDATDEPSES